ncbi:MAG: AI-2E family transporter, partial [Alphaproteobacteria bacterium]|nr:AI-2E family transporter [Alphaproteobacteria bacterium]
AHAVDDTLSGFLRGQSSVCLTLGLGYGVALALAGLPFGFTIGLMSGLVSFIPYMGSMFGFVASVGLALVEFNDPLRIGIVAAIFVAGQAIEGNVLTPKLVGDKVNLHPVWVMFALFAGGSLMGFVGMLIAVPVAAVIGVGVRFLVAQYRASDLYDHGGRS